MASRLAVGEGSGCIRWTRGQFLQRWSIALLDVRRRAFQVESEHWNTNCLRRMFPADTSPPGRWRVGPTGGLRSFAMEHRRACIIRASRLSNNRNKTLTRINVVLP